MSEKPTYEELEELICQLKKDKSDRKRAETSLRIFKEGLGNSTDAVGMSTPHGRHYYQNQAFDRLFGDIGENPPDTLYVDKTVGEEVFSIIKSGGQWTGETKMYAKDGQILDIYLRAYANKNENGNIMSLFGIHTDITKQKQTESALKRSEERYRKLVQDQTEVICRFLMDGTIIFANDVFCRFFGKSYDDLVGQKWTPVVHPDDVEMIQEKLKTMLPSNRVVLIENRVYSGKGDLHWMQFINRGFYDKKGTLIEIQSVGRDITERKKAEKVLKESKEILNKFMDSATDGFILMDSELNHIEMNKVALEITGLKRENVIGKNIIETVPNIKETDRYAKYINVIKTGIPIHFSDIQSHPLTRDKHINLKAFKVGDGIGFIFTDITERVQYEKQLKKTHEILEEKVKERTDELQEMNTALKVLLKKRDDDKKAMEEKIFTNYQSLISPFLRKLKKSLTKSNQQNLMDIVESNLKEFLLPFSQKLSDPMVNLTPTEIQIASMVKQGLSNKEMAQTLNSSIRTITNHRQHIRIKLDLKNKKINLRSFLSTL